MKVGLLPYSLPVVRAQPLRFDNLNALLTRIREWALRDMKGTP